MASPPTRAERATPVERRLEDVVSQLASVEQQLEHAQKLAMIGTLAAGVAHEINNILTPVLSYAHLARSRPDDAEFQERASQRIIGGVESACAVVQAIMSFGQQRDETAQADVAEVIAGTLKCLARDPAKDGIAVDIDVPSDLIVAIRPLALQQVVMNLLINAMAVLRSRSSARIQIVAERLPDREEVRLGVSDNGPGIAPDLVETIFDAFVSTKSGGDSSSGGAGLGLMVSRHLIEQAGGSISVESPPGGGARFAITLPANDAIVGDS